jgi:peptidoglycan hydrolase-like protein with peptidoglycan-binding domain
VTWEPTVYRDIWATDLRLVIDGKDVTYYRETLAQVGGYQLQEPYAFGPADFAFPQVTIFEVDKHGIGSLGWLRHGARAALRPIIDGAYGDPVWAGVVTSIQATNDGTNVHCDGDVSGRLALRDKQPPVFSFRKDFGLIAFDALLACGVRMLPYLGPHTGIERFNVGGGTDYLSDVNELLASALTADGGQWTIARQATGRRYEMRLKDTTTIDASVFLGAYGVTLDVTRDVAEEPTTFYGYGTDPTGQKITNARISNLFEGPPADYPFTGGTPFGLGTTDADTDTGAGMYAMLRKLVGMGYLSRAEAADSLYDADTVDAVQALQRDAGLTASGTMNPATWNALFNVTVTGRSLYGARVFPMAQLSAVRRFHYTANGSVDTANPNWDPTRMPVDRTVDHGGGVWKQHMMRFSQRLLAQTHDEKNWVGVLNLDGADVFTGNVGPATVDPTPMSRLDLREGQNIKVVGFDGAYTLFHISGINVGSDRNLSCAVDTRARDLLTLGQIIERNKVSRASPSRDFKQSIRRPNALNTMVVSNELFGLVDEWPLAGNRWNRVLVPCGQSGSIDRVRVHLRDEKVPFVMGVTVRNISPSRMDAIAGSNPLDTDSKWKKEHVQNRLKNSYLFLYTAGQATQPLGYYPRRHRGDNDVVTDAPVTGSWEDDAGFAFRTFYSEANQVSGVLYVLIYVPESCVLKAGKLLWVNHAEGA